MLDVSSDAPLAETLYRKRNNYRTPLQTFPPDLTFNIAILTIESSTTPEEVDFSGVQHNLGCRTETIWRQGFNPKYGGELSNEEGPSQCGVWSARTPPKRSQSPDFWGI